jgi:hypothetical protein
MKTLPGEIEVPVHYQGLNLDLHGVFEKGSPCTFDDPGYGAEFILTACYHADEDIIHLLDNATRSDLEGIAVRLLEDDR